MSKNATRPAGAAGGLPRHPRKGQIIRIAESSTSPPRAGRAQQPQQSRTEQPRGGRQRHGGDIAGAHSPRVEVEAVLIARVLVAVVEVEVPRVVGIRRVLRTGPVVVGLDVYLSTFWRRSLHPTGWESCLTGIPACIVMPGIQPPGGTGAQ